MVNVVKHSQLSAAQRSEIKNMRLQGATLSALKREFRRDRSTIFRVLKSPSVERKARGGLKEQKRKRKEKQ